ncbi:MULTISPECIES: DUF3012 domain-containing protein [Vibrio]|uniref:DUF3012 domain-containing protein n=1 Tax=Vibrio TaxID=662 RepID=UPI000C16D54A|nr:MULTISPECIES: DUF3012 domain-containing protein [Vibrio]NAW68281.1 DUF3012 domain-containing protein [Vibrio sp. V28_P6S34P95]NAX05856.1 DUF3012 domain-containing protein [Vibrio sp. V30_P3S12P165]NAX33394.1 DUF3012 domain-containing protein [Vibrio sp. V29_P1S30P107]NAX36521.1 DUF3012 domain-containing protein [Vibrio sp. V27_P1S3P104]NAX39478.1 DUF3012 domain-containing protein [Vibrio sp. V26_P1S5P106]
MKKQVLILLSTLALSACENEVGTASWCQDMRDKPKSEWSAQGALDFTKHCLLQSEIGSQAWCEDMQLKPKGDWTANEATSYAKHCIF